MGFLDTYNHLLYFFSAGPTAIPFSCQNFTSAWETCQEENSRTGEPILQESMSEFSMKLFSHLRESQPSSNLLFSPISISMVLTHLLLGMKPTILNILLSVNHSFTYVGMKVGRFQFFGNTPKPLLKSVPNWRHLSPAGKMFTKTKLSKYFHAALINY